MANKRNTTTAAPVSNLEGWGEGDYAYLGIQHTNGATQHVLVQWVKVSLDEVSIRHRGKPFDLKLAGFDFKHRMPLVDIRSLTVFQRNELCFMPY